MLIYPYINPIAIEIGPLSIYWYGIMYLLGFAGAWLLGLWRAKKSDGRWTSTQVGDLIFFAAIGVIVGGRVGYVLFYDFANFISNPFSIFAVWQGGMAFHGGLVGVALALWWFSHKQKKHYLDITDFIAPLVPFGLAVGRIGNFINGELWGRVTTVPWGMVFPHVGPEPRHPSMLYEGLLEGVLLFVILWWVSAKPKPRGMISALFLILYGGFRFFVEFFRQPDPQLGFIAFNWLTMGQLLSSLMITAGIILFVWSFKNKSCNNT
ncbi:MAG: prolipoprotein diacylglyceryl transferase [Gammaproteobacteria bacterium]